MPEDFRCGPTTYRNPPSKKRTESVTDGKFDEYGQRSEVDVPACAMLKQGIETVSEPRQRPALIGQLNMFDRKLLTMQKTSPAYGTQGKHTLCVKVVDVFGCDTSIALEALV